MSFSPIKILPVLKILNCVCSGWRREMQLSGMKYGNNWLGRRSISSGPIEGVVMGRRLGRMDVVWGNKELMPNILA